MSNLYKQRYIINDKDNTRVINSNTKVEKKLEELAREAEKSKKDSDGFVAGLNLEQVDAVPKEDEVSFEELARQTNAEVEEMLANAKTQAEVILEDAKVQAASIQEQSKEKGRIEGLTEGRAAAEQELAGLRRELEAERGKLEEDYRQKAEELEPKLVDVISDVFQKVFQVQFDDKKEILLYLIQNTLSGIEGTKEFQIRVGNEDGIYLEQHKEEIAERVGKSAAIEIIADVNMKSGQCMIETDSGVFDCGTDVQLENLIKTMKTLSL